MHISRDGGDDLPTESECVYGGVRHGRTRDSRAAQAATVSKTDREFMNTAATMNMTAAHAAQMAQDKATGAEVKDFARMLNKDDSEAFGRLAKSPPKPGCLSHEGSTQAEFPNSRP